MTEPSSTTAPDLGLFARAIGMFTSPTATFRSVVATPRPASFLFLVCVLLALGTGLPQLTEKGRQAALDMQIRQTEQFTGQPVNAQAREGMERMSQYSGYLAMGSVFVFVPVVTLLVAGIYWLIFNVILGGTADFKQVLGVIAHSQIILAVGTLIGTPLQYAMGEVTATGPFHLGALAAAFDPSSAIARLLGALTIFGIWQSIVSGLGIAVLYRRRPTGIVIALLLLYVAMTAFFYVVLPSFFPAGTR